MNDINKINLKQDVKLNNIKNLKKISYNKINKNMIKRYFNINNNKRFYIRSKNKSDFNIKNNDQMRNSLINDKSPDLDWTDYESIYNHLISYINLMIIDLSKDNNKLCKYLKEVFFAIFTISQKTKNHYNTIYTDKNRKTNNVVDKNNSINDINKISNNSTSNAEWNFITGEITNNNNTYLIEPIYGEEKKNNDHELSLYAKKNVTIKPIMTPGSEISKFGRSLEISFLEEKFEKLHKKMKRKEKLFKIDKLKYLLKINKQNKLINELENHIKLNSLNNLSDRSINEIKCFPDYSKIYENFKNYSDNEENNKSMKLGCLKKKIDRKKFFISHPKINFSDISINGKNCHDLNDIINKNLFKLRNKGKFNRSNFSKFTFISINDTKMQVQKMINKH